MKTVINEYEYLLKLDIKGLVSFIRRHSEKVGENYAKGQELASLAEYEKVSLAETLLNEKISHYVDLTGVEI